MILTTRCPTLSFQLHIYHFEAYHSMFYTVLSAAHLSFWSLPLGVLHCLFSWTSIILTLTTGCSILSSQLHIYHFDAYYWVFYTVFSAAHLSFWRLPLGVLHCLFSCSSIILAFTTQSATLFFQLHIYHFDAYHSVFYTVFSATYLSFWRLPFGVLHCLFSCTSIILALTNRCPTLYFQLHMRLFSTTDRNTNIILCIWHVCFQKFTSSILPFNALFTAILPIFFTFVIDFVLVMLISIFSGKKKILCVIYLVYWYVNIRIEEHNFTVKFKKL